MTKARLQLSLAYTIASKVRIQIKSSCFVFEPHELYDMVECIQRGRTDIFYLPVTKVFCGFPEHVILERDCDSEKWDVTLYQFLQVGSTIRSFKLIEL